MTRTALGLTAALALAITACQKKAGDPDGVGPWQFSKSKLADAETAGRCLPPQGFVQCVGLSSIQIGKQKAETDLYFASEAKDANLVEIALSIRSCDVSDAGQALEKVLGPAKETLMDGKLRTWSYSTMFVSARLPAKGSSECLINFVEPKDTARIAELRAGG
jgi:hypothetical protein